MKKLLLMLCILISLQGFTQVVKRVESGNTTTFVEVPDSYVGQYLHDNQSDSVFITSKGKFWYWKVSKNTGKQYKAYLKWIK